MSETPPLILTPGPHIGTVRTTAAIMWWVNLSLAPMFLWAIYIYGLRVVWLLLSGIMGCVVGEWLVNRLRGHRQSLRDGSAVLTGILMVGTISPGMPFWMPAIGGLAGIIFAKMLFGGLGSNIFNPALIGRAFLMATFPVGMTTTWQAPHPGALLHDAVTQASPLGILKMEGATRVAELLAINPLYYRDLFLGLRSGSIGEVSLLCILIGAAILLWKRIITFTIPLSVMAGLLIVLLISGAPIAFHLLTGGVWFGAWYMATDYVTAPILPKAQLIFGLGIGLLTGAIRVWGAYPEGICYAILIMNAITPALNQWFRPHRPALMGAPS